MDVGNTESQRPSAYPKDIAEVDGARVSVTFHESLGGHGPVYFVGSALGVCLACGLATFDARRYTLAPCEAHAYKDGRTGVHGGPHNSVRKTHGRGR